MKATLTKAVLCDDLIVWPRLDLVRFSPVATVIGDARHECPEMPQGAGGVPEPKTVRMPSAACDARRHRQRIICTPFLVVFRDDAAAACVQPVLETDLVERLLRSFGVDRTPSYLGDVQILGLRRIT